MALQTSKEKISAVFAPARSADSETLIGLMREFNAFEELPFDEEKSRRALRQILEDETFGRVFLIKEGELVAGYAVLTVGFSFEYHGRDAFLDELYLREDFRGKGLGTSILRFLEDLCRKLGVNALHLEVERKNENAQKVYRKNGFEDHDRFLMTKRIK